MHPKDDTEWFDIPVGFSWFSVTAAALIKLSDMSVLSSSWKVNHKKGFRSNYNLKIDEAKRNKRLKIDDLCRFFGNFLTANHERNFENSLMLCKGLLLSHVRLVKINFREIELLALIKCQWRHISHVLLHLIHEFLWYVLGIICSPEFITLKYGRFVNFYEASLMILTLKEKIMSQI